jgi:hypothetical protein
LCGLKILQPLPKPSIAFAILTRSIHVAEAGMPP